jgi:predicted PurR-regulated permease PerM
MFSRPVHGALLTFSAFVIAVAGLKLASSLLVPILAAAFVALIISSGVTYLRDSRLPDPLAIPAAILISSVVFGSISLIIARSAQSIADNSDALKAKLDERLAVLSKTFNEFTTIFGVDTDLRQLIDQIQIQDFTGQISQLVSSFGGLVSTLFLITIYLIFMLMESRVLPDKVRELAGDGAVEKGGRPREIVRAVQQYLIVKTTVAIMTGTLAGLACWAIGVPYAPLWGFLAFLFDFIPAVGAFFAAIPAGIVALLMLGPLEMVLTLGAFLVVNATVGNFIEPRMHGKNQSLSPLFVILSLVFWGWVFGPVGMLLAVPLSMILKISLEDSGEFNAFSVLVSNPSELKKASTAGKPQERSNA